MIKSNKIKKNIKKKELSFIKYFFIINEINFSYLKEKYLYLYNKENENNDKFGRNRSM